MRCMSTGGEPPTPLRSCYPHALDLRSKSPAMPGVPAIADRSDWPRVSVVVALYNAEDTVRDCVESLLQLDYQPDRLELVCVDNASTDVRHPPENPA